MKAAKGDLLNSVKNEMLIKVKKYKKETSPTSNKSNQNLKKDTNAAIFCNLSKNEDNGFYKDELQ